MRYCKGLTMDILISRDYILFFQLTEKKNISKIINLLLENLFLAYSKKVKKNITYLCF